MLSFDLLQSAISAQIEIELGPDLIDPWDLVVEPPKKLARGMVEMTYLFMQSRWESAPLLVYASKIFPTLCFVLGEAGENDCANAYFIHRGRSRKWQMPMSLQNKIVKTELKKHGLMMAVFGNDHQGGEDEIGWALKFASWEMVKVSVAHWNKQCERTLKSIAFDLPTKRLTKSKWKPTRR